MTTPESPFDAFADGYQTLWICIPESMKEAAGVSEVTASGGVWAKVSRNKEGPESGSSTSDSYLFQRPKGRLHLRVVDPITGEHRWAEHSATGKPLKLLVDSTGFGASAYLNFDASLEGWSFNLSDTIPASETHTNPMPQGITYAGSAFYLVSDDPDATPTAPEGFSVAGVIRPGVWNTEGKFALDNFCQWLRVRDPNTSAGQGSGYIIQSGTDPGPQGITIERTDWGFMTMGYQQWTLDRVTWSDGTYIVGEEIQPGTYVTPGPLQDRASVARWEVLDSSANVIRSGEVGQEGGNATVVLGYTDYAFTTQNFYPWQYVSPPEEAPEDGVKPHEWRHLLNMEHRTSSTVHYDNIVVEESGRQAGLGYLVGNSRSPVYYLAADPGITGYFTVDFGYYLAFLQNFAPEDLDKMQAAVVRFSAWAWGGDGYAELLDVGTQHSFDASVYGRYDPLSSPAIVPISGPLAGLDIKIVRPYGVVSDDSLMHPAGKVVGGININELEVRYGTEFSGVSSASGGFVHLNQYLLWQVEYPKEYILEGKVKTFALTMRESSGVSSLFLSVNAGMLY